MSLFDRIEAEAPSSVDDGALASVLCRDGCGACCIAPSITSAIPVMPNGKPAGVRCAQLADDNRCRLFGDPSRPTFCSTLRPSVEMCGDTREDALRHLVELEILTAPTRS